MTAIAELATIFERLRARYPQTVAAFAAMPGGERSLAAVVSLVPFGLGYWLALGPTRRTLHDRIAHTRVVRA